MALIASSLKVDLQCRVSSMRVPRARGCGGGRIVQNRSVGRSSSQGGQTRACAEPPVLVCLGQRHPTQCHSVLPHTPWHHLAARNAAYPWMPPRQRARQRAPPPGGVPAGDLTVRSHKFMDRSIFLTCIGEQRYDTGRLVVGITISTLDQYQYHPQHMAGPRQEP